MAVTNALMKAIGNEFVNAGKGLVVQGAKQGVTSALGSVLPQVATNAATKAAITVPTALASSALRIPVQQDNYIPLYHQTAANSLADFSLDKRNAGLSDVTMPSGIFLKETADDIGLPGKNQLQLDARINNPLRVMDREDLRYKLMKMDPKVTRFFGREKDLDNYYNALYDEKQKAVDKAYEAMYYDKSDANKLAFSNATKDMEGIIPEWRSKIRENASQSQQYLNDLLKKSGYDSLIVDNDRGSFGRSVKSYLVLDKDQLRDNSVPVRIGPAQDGSSELNKLYRGQLYSNTDFSYNSELMNSNPEKWGSGDVGKGYHFTPYKDKAGTWEGNDTGGIIEIGYKPDQILKADEVRSMIADANKLLADDKYMAKLWQEDEALAEQIEKIASGDLEALAHRENKPFVEHISPNDDELGTVYYYKDIDEGLTEKFREQFRKSNAKKYLGDPKIQYSKVDSQLSPQQQEFFKNSVIRDENGQLLPVYHSTPAEFTVFDNARLGENTGYDNTAFGHFVTTDKDFSSRFGDIKETGTPGRTMELYANVEKPIIHPYQAGLKYPEDQLDDIVKDYLIATDNQEALDALIEYATEDGTSLYDEYMDQFFYGDNPLEYSAEERKALEANGYDAVEFVEGAKRDLINSGDDTTPVSSYAIFDGKNLKSVDNLNPTGNPDIRYAKGGKTLTEMANDIKAERAAKELSPDVRRIGSTEVMDIDANTLPAGYEKLTKYLEADPNAIIEQYIGGKPEDVDFTDKLAKFIEQEGYETKPNVVDNLRIARQIINDKVAEDLDAEGATKYGQFLRTRGALQKDNPNRGVGPRTFTISANKNQIYQTDAAKLDKEYSDRLGIGRSHTPMNDKALSTDAKGYYMGGGIGINPTEAIGESGVSTIAHERMHSWQDIKPGEWDSRVVDAVQELRDELKEFYHTKAEIKAYRRSGSDLDYYADPNEQEARMLQSYLDNENFTDSANRHKTSGVEWGEEIKPAFDKFYKKLRELSKLGVALPAVAALFGLSLNGGEDVDNIE